MHCKTQVKCALNAELLRVQVLDVLEKVFLTIFDGLNDKCAKQLKAINEQYPFEPLQVC